MITLDTAGANYRSVWAMHKHFPHIKTFVRAFDIENGGWVGACVCVVVVVAEVMCVALCWREDASLECVCEEAVMCLLSQNEKARGHRTTDSETAGGWVPPAPK